MTNAALRGKPDAGNPHVRFDEGEVASATTPRRGSLLYTATVHSIVNFARGNARERALYACNTLPLMA